jgi:hypothetical protein
VLLIGLGLILDFIILGPKDVTALDLRARFYILQEHCAIRYREASARAVAALRRIEKAMSLAKFGLRAPQRCRRMRRCRERAMPGFTP